MDMTLFSIKNKVTIIMLYVLVILGGLKTYNTIEKGEDPPFTIKTSTITTTWPGATANEMAELVGDKIEEVVENMEELDFVETKNTSGLSVTYVNLKPEYTDLPPIWEILRKKIKYEIEPFLPEGVSVPNINDDFGDVYGSLIMITGEGYNYHDLAIIAEDVRRDIIRRVPEAGKIEIYGKQNEKMYISFDREMLTSLGISSSDIIEAVSKRNQVKSSGNVIRGGYDLEITSTGDFKSIEDLENLVISSTDLIYLKDIAKIERGYEDPTSYIARFQGKNSIGVGVTLKTGMDDTKLGTSLNSLIKDLRDSHPAGVEFDFLAYSPERVVDKTNSFVSNLIQAIITVLLVMLISLGFRTGLIVASLIPTSIAMAFILMPYFGVNLDQMSLAGLIIALGMLVDNAIVMSESIMIAMEKGESRLDACLNSSRQLKIPLLMSSLTTVAAFVPIFLIDESMGEYVGPMAKVVVFTLLSSWVVSMTLVPLLCFIFLKVDHKEHTYNSITYTTYRKILLFSLRNKAVTIASVVGMFFLGIFLFTFTGKEFIPESDQRIMLSTIRNPKGSSIEKTEEVVKALDIYVEKNLKVEDEQDSINIITDALSGFTARKYKEDGVLNWGSFIGGGAPKFILSYNPEAPSSEYAYVIYNTTRYENITEMGEEVDDYIKEKFPDVEIATKRMANGPATDSDVGYRLSGDNLEKLFKKVEIVEEKLDSLSISKNVKNTWKNKVKRANLEIDNDEAKRLGVSREDISNVLSMNLEGSIIGSYREPESRLSEKTLPILLRGEKAHNDEIPNLETISIYSPAIDSYVTLNQIAKIKLTFEYGYIYKRDRVYTVEVQGDARPGYTSNDIDKIMSPWIADKMQEWEGDRSLSTKVVAGLISKVEGPNYKYEIGGSTEESNKQSDALSKKIPFAGVFILLLLVAQFNSLKKPLIILLTIPLGILGVSVGLIIGQQNFGFFAIIALVSLSGVVVNNAIVLIDQIEIEINENCLDPNHAIIVSAQERFRPILLTTITTLCGLIPLWLFGGTMWKPMAISLIFGLIFATILTLGVVPTLYSLFYRISYKNYKYKKID